MGPSRFVALLESFRSKRIAVVGDYLLDEYIVGSTSRVSREAPIVVVDYLETVFHPGGAANAAQNITAAGADAVSLGLCGDDGEGDTLVSLLRSKGVETRALERVSGCTTPLKLRIMAGEMNAQKQQVARVDRPGRLSSEAPLVDRLVESVESVLSSCDGVLVSDYGEGLVPGPLSRRIIDVSRERALPVVVDSRFRLNEYPGATVATPNEVEALDAVGLGHEPDVDVDGLARALRDRSGIEQFVVTRGSEGMLVCASDGSTTTVGIVGGGEATDVTGAGDTVSAFVALSLASGATILEAAQMATYAASVVVMKRGTATASRDELARIIERNPVF